MSVYANITPTAAARADFAQSSDPADLQARVNAVFTVLAGIANQRVAIINLGGAGDGHTFVVEILSAPVANLVGSGLDPAVLSAFCYMAADAFELAVQRARESASIPLGRDLGDEQFAGAAQGTRFMGLMITAPTPPPPP